MAWIHIAVRVAHVLLGAFWAGAIFFVALFLDPATREAGPEGGKVMGILQRRGFIRTILTVATLTVASGLWLLWSVSGGFAPGFMGSRSGILLSTGMLAGILALGVGAHGSRPTVRRIGELAERMASAGGPPPAEDLAELGRLRGKLTTYVRIAAVLLLVAVVTMALGPHL